MEYWPKHIISFFLTSLLSNIIFIVFLKTTNYSGGQIGMAPFITFLNAACTFGISMLVLICLKMVRIKVPVCVGLGIFSIVSTLTLFIYFRINPFSGTMPDVDLWALLSVIIAALLICISDLVKKNFA